MFGRRFGWISGRRFGRRFWEDLFYLDYGLNTLCKVVNFIPIESLCFVHKNILIPNFCLKNIFFILGTFYWNIVELRKKFSIFFFFFFSWYNWFIYRRKDYAVCIKNYLHHFFIRIFFFLNFKHTLDKKFELRKFIYFYCLK